MRPLPQHLPGSAAGWVTRLGPFLRAHGLILSGAVITSIIGQTAFGLAPLLQQRIVDEAILAGTSPLMPFVVALLVIAAVHFGATFARRYLGTRYALEVQHDLRRAIHHHTQRLDLAAHDRLGTGELMTRATADVTLVGNFLGQFNVIVGNLVQLAVAFAVMFYLSPPLTAAIAVLLPVFLLIAARYRLKVFPASWADQQAQANLAGAIDDAVTGVRVVKAFGQESREIDRVNARSRDLFRSRLRTARITARYTAWLRFVPVIGQVVILAMGGWLVLHDHITLGTFLAFSSYLVQMVGPVRMLSGVVMTAQQARAGAVRVFEVLDITSEIIDPADGAQLPPKVAGLDFDNVSFAYPGTDRPVLKSCTFSVLPGETVAIVGASGSGKSTVAHLINRLYDVDEGAVRVGGIDVRAVTKSSLRSEVSLVFEESFLFSRGVGDNLGLANPEATEQDMFAALKGARAAEFVTRLPNGLDTPVGENGLSLSGGQRQRLSLARAFLVDPSVLVLDDATSSIDAATEAEIFAHLKTVMIDRTVVLVAHRHSTIALADRIVVLDNGSVAAQGTHEQLLEASAIYRNLVAGAGAPDTDSSAASVSDPDSSSPGGLDLAAWPAEATLDKELTSHVVNGRSSTSINASTGTGLGGGGFNKTLTNAGLMEATEELLADLNRLPPLADEPRIDLPRETSPFDDNRFSFKQLLRPYWLALAAGIGFVTVEALTTLAGPLLIRHGVDSGVSAGDFEVVLGAAGAMAAVALLGLASTQAMTLQAARTSERLLVALRLRCFAHLQRLSLDYYEREMSGRIFARLTADIDSVALIIQQGMLVGATSLVSSMCIVIAMTVLSPQLALAVAALVPVAIVVTVFFQRASRRSYARARRRIAVMYADLAESLNGVRVTQALRAESTLDARFDDLSNDYRVARLTSLRLSALFFPFVQDLALIAKALVFVVGAAQVQDGNVTAGVLIAFLLFLDQFFTPVQQLSTTFDQWLAAKESLDRITELVGTKSGTPEPAQPKQLELVQGELSFKQVTFTYPGAKFAALQDVDLHVPAGQRIALVGATGAGKSTLAKLIARFYDPSIGTVLVDGVPLTDLSATAFRRRLGHVPQEPLLFAGTIRDNIAYGRPEATDPEVEAAARRVGAHAMIATLSEGYRTVVHRRGQSLSAGQRQLICLARAELIDPAILILDEATANLDLQTEAAVQQGMARAARGRTTVLIAHRLQTLRLAERILVIDQGRVIEDGSHDELIDAGGAYARLNNAGRSGKDLVEDELAGPAITVPVNRGGTL